MMDKISTIGWIILLIMAIVEAWQGFYLRAIYLLLSLIIWLLWSLVEQLKAFAARPIRVKMHNKITANLDGKMFVDYFVEIFKANGLFVGVVKKGKNEKRI